MSDSFSTQPDKPSKRKIEVAIIAASLRYVGGQSAQADLLCRAWRDDPDVNVRLIPIDPVFPWPLRWIEYIPGLRTLVREPIYIWNVWRTLAEVDVAHIFSASYWSFLIAPAPASWLASKRGKKALIHYHSGEARDHLQKFPSARRQLAHADKLVVPSKYLVDVFAEFGLRADVVANVIELDRFTFRERRPLRPHLICTRGFSPYYCVDVVVRAFAELKKLYPDARLDLVGGGPLESQIRSLVAQLNLSDVHFVGVAPYSEIHRHYNQAEIFINASYLDNMPVSILEAFAAGTPVVTTSPECMSYLVDHERTGLLSPVGDPLALAQNVDRLLRDPDLASRLARNALEECRNFSWKNVRQNWLDVYRNILKDAPSQAKEEQTVGAPYRP